MRSKAQQAALRRLHRARKGIPVNDCGLTPRQYLRVLGQVSRALAQPGGPSVRMLAKTLTVSDRTLRRWLVGHRIAPAWAVVRLKAMTAGMELNRGDLAADVKWAKTL